MNDEQKQSVEESNTPPVEPVVEPVENTEPEENKEETNKDLLEGTQCPDCTDHPGLKDDNTLCPTCNGTPFK